jgi:RNA polymerase sigma factor (TIGR02999 family)
VSTGDDEVPQKRKDHDVTRALKSVAAGDPNADDLLWQLTYDELRRIAKAHLRRESPNHTLSATSLVHEAYMRLADQTRVQWQNRSHFFGVASQACRRVLVDHARQRLAQKRGGGAVAVTLSDHLVVTDDRTEEILAVNRALERLATVDERLCKLVEYRYFGGLSEEETAEALDLSTRTVRREWAKAKGWLVEELRGTGPVEPSGP